MKRTSKVRRWLTYLTLFASACALIGDVTTLVYNALGGELTIRFVLKVTVDSLPAGVRLLPPRSSSGPWRARGSHVREARACRHSRDRRGDRGGQGIMIIGSPSEERTRRIDSRRVNDLQRIAVGRDLPHEASTVPSLAR